MGDGTVIVQLNKNGKAVYVHEDESLPVSNGSLAYAGLGAQNCTWVALMEKAWTYVRTSTASYASINAGWMDEADAALGGRQGHLDLYRHQRREPPDPDPKRFEQRRRRDLCDPKRPGWFGIDRRSCLYRDRRDRATP